MISHRIEVGHEIARTPENRRSFRVAIFGTGGEETEKDSMAMKDAALASGLLVEEGYSIATGGYNKGVMKAVSETAVTKTREVGISDSQEVLKAFPLDEAVPGKVVAGADVRRSNTLVERLIHLVDESDAFILLGGKFGTTVELATALHSERVRRLSQGKNFSDRPIIIIDDSLTHTDLLATFMKGDKKLSADKVNNDIYVLSHSSNIASDIKNILDVFYQKKNGKEIPKEVMKKMEEKSFAKFFEAQENFDSGGGI